MAGDAHGMVGCPQDPKKEREKEMGHPRSQHLVLESRDIESVTRRDGRWGFSKAYTPWNGRIQPYKYEIARASRTAPPAVLRGCVTTRAVCQQSWARAARRRRRGKARVQRPPAVVPLAGQRSSGQRSGRRRRPAARGAAGARLARRVLPPGSLEAAGRQYCRPAALRRPGGSTRSNVASRARAEAPAARARLAASRRRRRYGL